MARGAPLYISAQENEKLQSIIAFVQFLAEHLNCIGETLGFLETLVEAHYSNEYLFQVLLKKGCLLEGVLITEGGSLERSVMFILRCMSC